MIRGRSVELPVIGAYVRCIAGQDERKQPKYRLFQVVGKTPLEAITIVLRLTDVHTSSYQV
jgi:hypothetical protein